MKRQHSRHARQKDMREILGWQGGPVVTWAFALFLAFIDLYMIWLILRMVL